jgi:plastocyanin
MTPMTRWIAALAVVAAVAVAGCGSSSNSSSSSGGSGASGTSTPAATSAPSSGGGHSLKVAADPSGQLKFDTSQLNASPGKVTIAFTNMSGIPHAIAVEGHGLEKKGTVITKGSNSITVDLKKGTYTFYCPVDGHRAAGMKGTLTVG